MWLMRVVTTVVLLEIAWASVHTQVKVNQNGYESLVVGISPMVDEGLATALINGIKTSLTETSKTLFSATHKKLYFKDVKILLPKTWSTVSFDEPAQNERFEEADIRVKPSNSQQPKTLQPGLCREPGLYILLTPEYLMNDWFDNWWGPKGKVLTREWARFRWGVFEEMGFPNDPAFPLFYMDRTGSGPPELRPNTCTDKPLNGTFLDRLNRNSNGCNMIGGIPDENCRFVPNYKQEAESSLMGSVEFDTVAEFCDYQSHPHNTEAPTRQKLMCGKSAWEVMLDHPDFSGLSEAQPGTDVTPKFTLIKEEDANFALVLDYSGSMEGTRITSLQRSAQRWILHDVADGSTVGIVRFSSKGSLISPMTKITNENVRRALANKVTTNTGGGTCIGCGLQTALSQLLVNRRNKVILLITDGQENADPKIAQVINSVVSSGAQVLTIAFGSAADPKMEELAMKTRGKSYTVFDTDNGRMMDDAFQGALTYQPGNTLINTNIMIYEESEIASGLPFRESFTIDATLGRNLKFRLDAKAGVSVTANPVLTSPNGKSYNNVKIDSRLNLYTIDVATAETGTWWWSVTLSGNTINNVRVSITAQAKDPNTLPIITEAWTSVGSKNVDPSKVNVIIYARVVQGEKPVVGAIVRAYITSPDNTNAAQEVVLQDRGVGADSQKGDGIYSRYFTAIKAKGRYIVKAQVWDEGNAYVNEGAFSTNPRRNARSTRHRRSQLTRYDPYERPDYCCGSFVPFDPAAATKTEAFTRISGGGSFQVTVEPPSGDYLPPSPVRDLQVILETLDRFNLTWTATGDDLDSGTVSSYEICMSIDQDHILEGTCDESRNGTVRLDSSADMNMSDVLLEAGEEVLLAVQLNESLEAGTVYYIGLQAVDDSDRKSAVSNVVIVAIGNDKSDQKDSQNLFLGISNFYLILIIIGCILLVLLIVITTTTCLVMKKRRKNDAERMPLSP